MPIRLAVYEDAGWRSLLPLVYVRAVFQLICGANDLLSRIRRLTVEADSFRGHPDPDLWCRSEIEEIVEEETNLRVNAPLDGATLLLNGRGVWTALPELSEENASWVGTADSQMACIFAAADLAQGLSSSALLESGEVPKGLENLPRRDVSHCVDLIRWPWELVSANGVSLEEDWRACSSKGVIDGGVDEGAHILGGDSVTIGSGSRIMPGAVIDAETGPVWIGSDVKVMPHAYIKGPTWIGDGCRLNPGVVIREDTTIGPFSRVGGEIVASIVHGHANKQHYGFLGNSYICPWANLAAGCTNSNVKNTYGRVRVPINGEEVNTGEAFVGTFVGDHSKAGINLAIPTGAVVGFCCSVFAPKSPRFVRSFSWVDGDRIEGYDEERGLAVAKKVMERRGLAMSPAMERAFLAVRQIAEEIESRSD